MAFRWRADDGPLIELFGSSPQPKKEKKTVSVLDSGKAFCTRACFSDCSCFMKEVQKQIVSKVFCSILLFYSVGQNRLGNFGRGPYENR